MIIDIFFSMLVCNVIDFIKKIYVKVNIMLVVVFIVVVVYWMILKRFCIFLFRLVVRFFFYIFFNWVSKKKENILV